MGRRAFVIMPFNDELDSVFAQLIRPALEGAGYTVERADSVIDQQSIMRDVINGIDGADLIVADLTGLNANVFYELGVAHGLGVPTVLLTQSIASLPFDLKAYRVIEYATRFDLASELTSALGGVAEAHAAGEITFGSPVSDFLPGSAAAERLSAAGLATGSTGGAAADRLTQAAAAFVPAMTAVGDLVARFGGQFLERATAFRDDEGNVDVALEQFSDRLARDLDEFTVGLGRLLADLSEASGELSDALLDAVALVPPEDSDVLANMREQMRRIRDGAESAGTNIARLRQALEAVPDSVPVPDVAVTRAATELYDLEATLSRVKAYAARGVAIADERLEP